MPRPPDLLDTTERIAGLLAEQGIEAMVIGAAAMAAHRYARHPEDLRFLPKTSLGGQGRSLFPAVCYSAGLDVVPSVRLKALPYAPR